MNRSEFADKFARLCLRVRASELDSNQAGRYNRSAGFVRRRGIVLPQPIENELHEQLERLDPSEREKVLEFARSLAASRPEGMSADALIQFSGTIDPSDLEAMSDAIESGCEQVDPDEW